MGEVRAIETLHNGYRFRSRLEARWAVFLDTLCVEYDYEKEGFDFDGKWYLPDFFLKHLELWIEIKPEKEECPKCGFIGIEFSGRAERLPCGCLKDVKKCYNFDSPRLIEAYLLARTARFEHGE